MIIMGHYFGLIDGLFLIVAAVIALDTYFLYKGDYK
jgi:hypothetical protein